MPKQVRCGASPEREKSKAYSSQVSIFGLDFTAVVGKALDSKPGLEHCMLRAVSIHYRSGREVKWNFRTNHNFQGDQL